MPSSLIIVALAVAWLVVLVPMVARKRQEIARTGEDALAARVVRSGGARDEREESMMPESEQRRREIDRMDDATLEAEELDEVVAEDPHELDELAEDETQFEQAPRYRKGRGGFDPEAAELAARAKYTFRQRVVVALLATVLMSALLAGFVLPALWWVTGCAGTGLVGYLGYLRRQVRIEENIRQRRLARLAGARSSARRRAARDLDSEFDAEYGADYDGDYEVFDEEPMTLRGVERKPRPQPRVPRRNTVVVDLDDEDPAFHELDEPGLPVYRRAVGE